MAEEALRGTSPGEPARRGPVRARREREVGAPEYLPARMLNEYVYCPRLFFYEWVEGLFADSADTVEGRLRHEKTEAEDQELPPADSGETIHSRSVTLASDTYGLIAVIDLVEGEAGSVTPVEYKKGRPRDGEEGPEAWPADRVQVCAQALILRDNGYRCDEAIVYYDRTRQRVRVRIDEKLLDETISAARAARKLAEAGEIPPPLVDSPKCPRCSLVGICLPDETAALRARLESEGGIQLELFRECAAEAGDSGTTGTSGGEAVRRLVPARDDLRPLYVAGHGVTVGKKGGVLEIRKSGEVLQEVRLNEISQLNVFGNVQLTASAIHGLCEADKPIAHFSYGGWFYGLTRGMGLKNVFLRRDQFAAAADPSFRLAVARELVASKIRNQRTLLQRNHLEPPQLVLRQLRRCAELAEDAEGLQDLLGIEGTAARIYFESFSGMIKVEAGQAGDQGLGFDFRQRNRRPPRDPVNALLSFGYSLLAKELMVIAHAIGFDPYLGFYHEPRFGRPALALDLMEEFRPLIADSAVLAAINNRMVTPEHFVRVGNAVALTATGRKAFIRAFELRMDTLVTHPLFGYRVNYRRVLEVQARLLARVVSGEIARYRGFETR